MSVAANEYGGASQRRRRDERETELLVVADTAAKIEGLEVVPRKRVEYRGVWP